MATDARCMEMVVVINCVLNQNARAEQCAVYGGMNHEAVDVLRNHDVGVIQMPCPEMVCLGLPRERPDGRSILDVLDTPRGRSCCRRLALSVVDDIEEYLRHGYRVPAILGGDVGSPGCAVHVAADDGTGTLLNRSGVFMKALQKELRDRNIDIPFRGLRDSSERTLHEDLAWLDDVLQADRVSADRSGAAS